MSRFNQRGVKPAVGSPVRSTGERTINHQGGAGYLRDARSELFLLAVANFVGTDTFYESGGDRDDRYTQLIRQLAVDDPEWVAQMLSWLRREGNMRTAAIVGAAEYVKARLEADKGESGLGNQMAIEQQDGGWNRRVVASVLRRADEPGELLAYWTSRYGKPIPKPIKRGIEDSIGDLYTERALLKYDSAGTEVRFGDVIALLHPKPKAVWQEDLFRHAIDRRHNRDNPIPDGLQVLHARAELSSWTAEQRRALLKRSDADFILREAGMTWESLAGWLQGPMDAAAWEAIIPSMGYMALLRNLRNFDESGVSDDVAATVAAKLADAGEVARSRQLPMRFYSAFNAAPSLRWGHALEQALTASLANIPTLGGRTLVMVDTSSSMEAGFSRDGSLNRWDAAALFGVALGRRCASADVVSFSSARYYINDRPGAKTKAFPLTKGGSLLGDVRKWKDGGWFLGGGTDTAAALRQEFKGHDRVVIVTDEQAGHDVSEVTAAVPGSVPMYTWNLAGYEAGHAPSGGQNRHTFGGLTDQAFRMIPLLESGRDAHWPWMG